MRSVLILRRLEKLATKICPGGRREFTLEELCRYWWRLNKRGFLASVKESPCFQVFADIFEREDAERIATAKRNARLKRN